MDTLVQLSIQYKAIVVEKKNLCTPDLRLEPQQMYCESVKRVLYDNDPPLLNAILTVDEAMVKIHHREFASILKKYLSRTIVQKIRQARSKGTTFIQVADMIAGSIFRKYEKGDDKYYQKIRVREKILIEF